MVLYYNKKRGTIREISDINWDIPGPTILINLFVGARQININIPKEATVKNVVDKLFPEEVKQNKRIMLYYHQYLNPYILIKNIEFLYSGSSITVRITDPISGAVQLDEHSKTNVYGFVGVWAVVVLSLWMLTILTSGSSIINLLLISLLTILYIWVVTKSSHLVNLK